MHIRLPEEIPDFEIGTPVEVFIERSPRKVGIWTRGVVIHVGWRQSLVQFEHYKESFWNNLIKRV